MKIIYISGSGRTGSTLMSLLLTQPSGIFNMGQSRDLPAAFADDAPCTCGATLHICNYWSDVLRRLYDDDAENELGITAAAYKAFKRQSGDIDWSSHTARRALRQEHADYLVRLSEFCRVAGEVAGAELLVDSSKSPELALALSLVDGVDLYTLNLVRDPRAVAVSWVKRNDDPSMALRASRRWRARQQRLRQFARANPAHFMTVRYEDFALQPRTTISRVFDWVGGAASPDFFGSENEAKLSWEGQHLFPPANESILARKPAEVTIRPAEDWKRPEHRLLRWTAARASFPTCLYYGYGLF